MLETEKYINNPYRVSGFEKRVITSKSKELTKGMLVDSDTGEAESLFTVPRMIEVDVDTLPFTKGFHGMMDVYWDLSVPGQKLWYYCFQGLKVGKDSVWLNYADVGVRCKIGKNSFYGAVKELIRKDVLARKLGSSLEFWVNPNVFFNGRREK